MRIKKYEEGITKDKIIFLQTLEEVAKELQKIDFLAVSSFNKQDIKGSYELGNFIAHDYEGIDLHIVEAVIKERLPIIKSSAESILS